MILRSSAHALNGMSHLWFEYLPGVIYLMCAILLLPAGARDLIFFISCVRCIDHFPTLELIGKLMNELMNDWKEKVEKCLDDPK